MRPDADGIYRFTMPAGEITIGVTFLRYTYDIIFDPNGGTGEMEPVETYYSVEETLPANTFTRKGYRFLRWNLAADGTGLPFSDGDTVKNLSDIDFDEVTLYAMWEPMVYVTFVNTTGGDITVDLSGSGANTIHVVNQATGKFSREQVTTTITIPAKTGDRNGEVKIVLI